MTLYVNNLIISASFSVEIKILHLYSSIILYNGLFVLIPPKKEN